VGLRLAIVKSIAQAHHASGVASDSSTNAVSTSILSSNTSK
jgi:hypothetical protein